MYICHGYAHSVTMEGGIDRFEEEVKGERRVISRGMFGFL